MINVKNEIQYILVTRTLENMALAGFLTAEGLTAAKRLAGLRGEQSPGDYFQGHVLSGEGGDGPPGQQIVIIPPH